MHIFHIFYMIGTFAAILAGIPQLRKLIQTKQAADFSITTWTIWLFSQVTALSYALSMKDVLYASVSAFWFVFYVVMVSLIFKYRNNGAPEANVMLTSEEA